MIVCELHKSTQTVAGHQAEMYCAVCILKKELAEAQSNARILAHAYMTDNRPPWEVVEKSIAYAVQIPSLERDRLEWKK